MKKFFFIFALVLMLSGCSMMKHGIENTSDTLIHYVTKIQHDTVQQFAHDSVFVSMLSKNDTIFITKYKERIIYKNRAVNKTDTVTVYKNRNVYINKETTKNKIPKWCWCLLGLNVLIIAFWGIKLYIKWQTRI